MALYEKSNTAVRTPYGKTDWFQVKTGVRQGCVLSPLLFITYMDKITKDANPEDDTINELLFADDQSLLGNTEKTLQEHVNNLNERCKQFNMKIGTTKTEAMKISKTPGPLNITVDNNKMKQVEEFKYLGSIFTQDGKIDREIEARIKKANTVTYQLAPILAHDSVSMETKRQLINSIFTPTLCYQAQTWTMNKSHQSKINACEMKCLRKTLNITRRDKVRNEIVRQQVGTTPCLKHIEKQRIKWFGHLTRLPADSMPARAYNQRMDGHKGRGRPRKRWIDGVKETLKNNNISMEQAIEDTRRRRLHLPSTPKGTRGRKK